MDITKTARPVRRFFFILFLRLTKLFRLLLAFAVFPQTCLLCGSPSVNGPLCAACLKKTLYGGGSRQGEGAERCGTCGKELISEKGLCSACRGEPVLKKLSAVLPLYPYRFWARDLLFLWKIQNHRSFSPLFAAVLFDAWQEHFRGVPVVPVPPRPGKIRQKGWDQICELADLLELWYGVPVLRILRRTEKKEQKKLSRAERRKEKRRFVLKNAPEKLFCGVPPKEVVVLDDILTTGSTLEKCAAELLAAGIKKVDALTLFIVE